MPGWCGSKAHDRENLGLGGRRVLVSRQWSGKTLAEHSADRATVVREALAAAGIVAPEADRLAADRTLPDGTPRFVWTDTDPDDTTYVAVIAASLRQARAWRTQYAGTPRPVAARATRLTTCGHQFGNQTGGMRKGQTMRRPGGILSDDRLWSVEDVSYFLGVSVQTVYAWRSSGHRSAGSSGGEAAQVSALRRQGVGGRAVD